jgi:hypothetical protein
MIKKVYKFTCIYWKKFCILFNKNIIKKIKFNRKILTKLKFINQSNAQMVSQREHSQNRTSEEASSSIPCCPIIFALIFVGLVPPWLNAQFVDGIFVFELFEAIFRVHPWSEAIQSIRHAFWHDYRKFHQNE